MKNLFKISGVILLIISIILIHSCKKDQPTPPVKTTTTVPTLTTTPASNITSTNAILGGNISSDGGATITERGMYWGTTKNPEITGTKLKADSITNKFSETTPDIYPDTTYYVKAYAINSKGIGYGNQVSFKTKELELAIIDVSHETGWDYWVIAKDGSNYFVTMNNNRPASVFFKPDNKKNGYNIFCDEKGLPSKMVIENYIFLFGNYRDQLVDIAVISPSGDISIQRNLKINIDLNLFYKKSYDADSALISGLKISREVIGIASCTIGLLFLESPAAVLALQLAKIGCLATFSEMIGDNFHFKIFGTTSTVIGIIAGAGECVISPWTACFTTAAEVGLTYKIHALENLGSINVANAEEQLLDLTYMQSPVVNTSAVSNIKTTSAICGGNVTSDGGLTVTERGVCWNATALPTTANNHTTDGTGVGAFVSSIKGLEPSTTYYVRAYAKNSAGTSFGDDVSFKTNSATYNGTFNGTLIITVDCAQWKDVVSSTIKIVVSGSGTVIDPYKGSMEINGSDVESLVYCNCDPEIYICSPGGTITFYGNGTVSGSQDKVEASSSGTIGVGSFNASFTNGTFSGSTLTGVLTFNLNLADAPIVETITLTNSK
jgi:hypothetical protein